MAEIKPKRSSVIFCRIIGIISIENKINLVHGSRDIEYNYVYPVYIWDIWTTLLFFSVLMSDWAANNFEVSRNDESNDLTIVCSSCFVIVWCSLK